VQNSLVRTVLKVGSATQSRQIWHWLPIRQRKSYKVMLTTSKAKLFDRRVRSYELFDTHELKRSLRSSNCQTEMLEPALA
jgi:hypothetical protein